MYNAYLGRENVKGIPDRQCEISKRKGTCIMKKLAMLCLCGLAAISVMTGCSNQSADGEENLGTVELSEYQGVKVDLPVPEVTDQEVEAGIAQALSSNVKEVEVDREAAIGDIVNIDYVGLHEGVEFEGGKAEDTDLTLGSKTFIDGFEDGLVGSKAGDKKQLDLTFPEDYSEKALAGQKVVFEVTVNAVKVKEEPQLDDAFVQSISEYKTVEEYKNGLRQDLEDQKMRSYETSVQEEILHKVAEDSAFKLNRSTVSKRYNTRVNQYIQQAKMFGGTLASMAKSQGMEEGQFREYIYAQVEHDVKNQLIINTIASKEGIVLEEGDKEAFAQLNGQTVETVVESYGEKNFEVMALNYKVLKFLSGSAVNEASGSQAEEAPTATETEAAVQETEAR